MNIGIIVRKLNVKGGVQRHVIAFARELQTRGHDVTLYTFYYSKENCYTELLGSLRVVVPDAIPQSRFFGGLISELGACKRLASLIDRNTEILNPHDHVSYRVAAYFKKRVRNIPSVWMMHDMPTKTFSYMRARHLDPSFHKPWWRRVWYRMFDWWDIHRFIRIQDAVTVLDVRDREWVKEYFGMNAAIVRNGIYVEHFPFMQRHSLASRPVSLLLVGIFLRHRRFEDAIEAFAKLRTRGGKARMTIIGDEQADPSYANEIHALVNKLALEDGIVFRGRISEEELREAYRSHDIFLFPNDWQSWGLAVFEAMASGLPVIVSQSAGASEVLTDNENALLVPPQSPEAIAGALQRMLSDAEFYARMSGAGRKFVEAHLSWKRYTDQMLEVFTDVIKKQ